MKLQVVLLVSTLAACGKANDLPAMKVEGEGIAKSYQVRFEDLARRADSILQRGNAIGVTTPDAANASKLFAAAKLKLSGPNCPPRDPNAVPPQPPCDVRGATTRAPMEIEEILTRKEPPMTADARRMALRKYIDLKAREWHHAYIEINAAFDAVESWITLAEQRPQQVSRNDKPVVPPPPTTPDVPPPGNPGQQGAGGTTPPPVQ